MPVSKSQLFHGLLVSTLAVLPALLVWPREFTNWDDQLFVAENIAVQYPTATNLLYLLTHPVAGNLIPVTMLTFVIDWQVYGDSAWGYALTNSLLYALGCLLLVRVLIRSGVSGKVAMLAGVLFAVHPAHVENVSWISGRKDLVCLVLLLGCQLAHIEYRLGDSRKHLWLSVVLLLLAGLAKPIAMSAGPALFLYDVLILRRRAADTFRGMWPHAVVCAGIVCLAFWSQAEGRALRSADDVRWGSVDRAAVKLVIDEMRCFIPVPYSPYYPQHIIDSLPAVVRWGAVCIVALSSLLLLVRHRKAEDRSIAAYFWWMAMVFLVPVSGIVPLGSTSFADRYLLIPSIASCLLVAWMVNRIPRRSVVLAAYGMALILAFVFHLRALDWSNSVRLWQSASGHYPSAVLPWMNLTKAHFQRGDLEQACDTALVGVAEQPGDISLNRNAAEILMESGRLDEAGLLIAAARRRGLPSGELDLLTAKLALRRGDASTARDILTSAVSREPAWAEAWNTISYAWEQLGDLQQATAAAEQSVRYDHTEIEFYRRLLALQQLRHNLAEMERIATSANGYLPHFQEAWQVRISVLRRMGRNDEADRVAIEARKYVPMRGGNGHNTARIAQSD